MFVIWCVCCVLLLISDVGFLVPYGANMWKEFNFDLCYCRKLLGCKELFLLSSLVSTSFYIYHFYLVISHWNLDCCNSYCPNFEISEWNGPYICKEGPIFHFHIPPIPRFGMHSSDFSKRSTKRAYNNPSCFDRKLTTHLLTASTSAYQV